MLQKLKSQAGRQTYRQTNVGTKIHTYIFTKSQSDCLNRQQQQILNRQAVTTTTKSHSNMRKSKKVNEIQQAKEIRS